MAKKLEIYKCMVCGNIVEVLHGGDGELVCCGQPMKLFVENTTDGAKEKHVPVIEKLADGFKVKVGGIPHPMEEKHYIEWIEVRTGNNVSAKGLLPGEKPEAEFSIADTNVKVRAYCNVHGLWTNRP